MADKMATTLIYRTMYEGAKLADPDQRLEFYDQLLAYAFDGVEPETDDKVVQILLAASLPLVDTRNEKAKAAKRRRSTPGNEGGGENGNMVKACFQPSETCSEHDLNKRVRVGVGVREGVSVGVNVGEGGGPAAAPAPESAEEVAEFVTANNITTVDPERFFAYYAARGWDGIRDWKMAVRAWAANVRKEHPPNKRRAKSNSFNGFAQHDYDFAAIERQLLQEQGRDTP